MSRFDEMLAGAVGMDPETGEIQLDRGSSVPPLPPGGGDPAWEDRHQLAYSAQEDADQERDRRRSS